MIEDEVIREVRAVREAFAASHGYDLRAMVAALHEIGVASGREVVHLEPRPTIAPPNSSIVAGVKRRGVSGDRKVSE